MNPRQTADTIAHDLASRLGARLQSVVLYGSVARAEFVEPRSDINLLVLLDRIDPPLLRRLVPAAHDWAEYRVNTMLLEEREWTRASDAFAVELLDMRDARIVLHGPDPVDGVDPEPVHARLQAERELRSRIIALHNGMVRCAAAPADLGELLMAALPSFVTYLRTTIRLAGRAVPAATRDVIGEGCRVITAPESGWLQALEARARAEPWDVDLDDDVVIAYNAAAERTAFYLDTLEGNLA